MSFSDMGSSRRFSDSLWSQFSNLCLCAHVRCVCVRGSSSSFLGDRTRHRERMRGVCGGLSAPIFAGCIFEFLLTGVGKGGRKGGIGGFRLQPGECMLKMPEWD